MHPYKYQRNFRIFTILHNFIHLESEFEAGHSVPSEYLSLVGMLCGVL